MLLLLNVYNKMMSIRKCDIAPIIICHLNSEICYARRIIVEIKGLRPRFGLFKITN